MKLVGIQCKEFIVKFKQGTGLNDMRFATSDVGSCGILLVERRHDMLTLYYCRPEKQGLTVLKIVAWNYLHVTEFECEGIGIIDHGGIAEAPASDSRTP